MKGSLSMAQPALDFDSLPEDEISRREVLEDRTIPSPNKPKIGLAAEARLAALEERTAQCYVGMEECTYRHRQLAKKIGDTVPTRSRSLSEQPPTTIA